MTDACLESLIIVRFLLQDFFERVNSIGGIIFLNVNLPKTKESWIKLGVQFRGQGIETKGLVEIVLNVINFSQMKAALGLDLVDGCIVIGIQGQGFGLECMQERDRNTTSQMRVATWCDKAVRRES